ncbi:MAG: tRNA (guanosine(37)-N1)-methyltransferase TrmD [Planctomycetes bacterium]|jgi:tRNA (guanine37-N1)-methyltransferase|nr:tRNA (guanosine(37)-N1)-methyltransferase TrmD [Planctomycetota bacterium]
MRIDILTLFPEMFESPLNYSILKRAQEQGLVAIAVTNIRDFAADRYRKVDDKPYGGGPGMVMMPGPVFDCFEHVAKLAPPEGLCRGRPALEARAGCPRHGRVILLTPQGTPFNQSKARELAQEDRLILIAGRYEGFDERIRVGLNAEQISIGDYILNGGELAAMVIVDAVVRLLPGALGDEDSAKSDSFSVGANDDLPLLEYPHYTRPEVFRGLKVPDILLSGDHAKIAQWRREQSLERTRQWRPDLLERGDREKGG